MKRYFYHFRNLYFVVLLLVVMLVLGARGGDDVLAGDHQRQTEGRDEISFMATDADNEDQFSLFVMDVESGERRAIAVDPFDYAWSPDGTKVAYILVSNAGRSVLTVSDGDGGNQGAILEDWSVAGFEWSPNSDAFVLAAITEDDSFVVSVVDADGRNEHRIADEVDIVDFEWSPDGTKVAYADQGVLSVVDRDGQNARAVMASELQLAQIRWSPDGSEISIVSSEGDHAELLVMDANGENVRTLAEVEGSFGGHEWSPDGQQIAYVPRNKGGSFGLSVVHRDGTDQRETYPQQYDDFEFSWLPDGGEIVFWGGSGFRSESGDLGYERLSVDSDERVGLLGGVDFSYVSRFKLSSDGGRLVFIANYISDDGTHSAFYVMDVDGSNLSQISEIEGNIFFVEWRPR
jgi:Tol biopolymer transport system component